MEKERKQAQTRILRKPELLAMVGLSDPTIWRMEKDGKFPKRIRLGGNSCGWISDEVDSWLEERMAERVAA
ncbi:MAG: AlpA family transcriptional regulator [Proteobacteria bacterium]|nr:AlpA family transcriptional regulator [Desulfobulbaceae bacterium]MBU4154055.1 AlpA family transcriptional regulator [Pseudomonadota bacterium]